MEHTTQDAVTAQPAEQTPSDEVTNNQPQDTTAEPPQKKRRLDPAADPAPMPTAKPSQIPNPNSKNQQKKAKRKQEWEDQRDARKLKRREKSQARKARDRERRQAEGDSPVVLAEKVQKHVQSVTVPVTIIVDCQFDGHMTDAERISLGSQLTRCYADNRKAKYRVHLAVSSFGGFLKDRFEGLLMGVYKKWMGVRFREDDWVAVSSEARDWMNETQKGGKLAGALIGLTPSDTPSTIRPSTASSPDLPTATPPPSPPPANQEATPPEIVYLTSDSPHTLSALSPHSIYIIGGIVDKNRHKGICYKLATEAALTNPAARITTAKLPIGDYMAMESRKVLTTNHVNEIMLKWLELGDWGEAFMKVIPKRKGGELRRNGVGATTAAAAGEDDCGEPDDAAQDVFGGPGRAADEEEEEEDDDDDAEDTTTAKANDEEV